MFSLPNISQMNMTAKQNKKAYLNAVKTGRYERKRVLCSGCEIDNEEKKVQKADRVYPVYDIFSDDPKGIIGLCEHHDGYYGDPFEGYFTCQDCERVMAENYTWELYYHDEDDGRICLPCYAKRVIADEDQEYWIDLSNLAGMSDKELWQTRIQKAPHCIGVKMPIPEGITFIDNAEFDSMSAKSISGGGASGIRQTLEELKANGYGRALVICDAGYQFAVSIGVYVDSKEYEKINQKREAV